MQEDLLGNFIEHGEGALSDRMIIQTLLETQLSSEAAQKKTNKLFKRFGDLNSILDASWEQLENMTEFSTSMITLIKLSRGIINRYLENEILITGIQYTRPELVANFLRAKLGSNKKECFIVICLDTQNRIIDHKIMFEGTIDQTCVFPREIFSYALENQATGLILAHNHPSESLTPSNEDKNITNKVETIARGLDIRMLDHFIVTKSAIFSIKNDMSY